MLRQALRAATIFVALLAALATSQTAEARGLLGDVVETATSVVDSSADTATSSAGAVNPEASPVITAAENLTDATTTTVSGTTEAAAQAVVPPSSPEPTAAKTVLDAVDNTNVAAQETVEQVADPSTANAVTEPVVQTVETATQSTAGIVTTTIDATLSHPDTVIPDTIAPTTATIEETAQSLATVVPPATEPLAPAVDAAVNLVDATLAVPAQVVDDVGASLPETQPILDPVAELPPDEPVAAPLPNQTADTVRSVIDQVVTPVTAPALGETIPALTDPLLDPIEQVAEAPAREPATPPVTPNPVEVSSEIVQPDLAGDGSGLGNSVSVDSDERTSRESSVVAPQPARRVSSNWPLETPAPPSGETTPATELSTVAGSLDEARLHVVNSADEDSPGAARTAPTRATSATAAGSAQPITQGDSTGPAPVAAPTPATPNIWPDLGEIAGVNSLAQATMADQTAPGSPLSGQIPAPAMPAPLPVSGGSSIASGGFSSPFDSGQVAALAIILLLVLLAQRARQWRAIQIPSGTLQTIPTPPG